MEDLDLVFGLLEDEEYKDTLRQRLVTILLEIGEEKKIDNPKEKFENLSKVFSDSEISQLNNVFA